MPCKSFETSTLTLSVYLHSEHADRLQRVNRFKVLSVAELRSATCHVGSHSLTWHPTQVNAPRLNSSQAGYAI